jgi:predicted PurR-regulated permease PerM
MESSRAFALVLVVTAGVLISLLVLPYLPFVLAAILLSYVLYPLHERLAPRVGTRASALCLMLATVFLLLLPIALLVEFVVEQLRAVLLAVERERIDTEAFDEFLQTYLGADVTLEQLVSDATHSDQLVPLFTRTLDSIGAVTETFVGLTVLAFVWYYLLRDGEQLVAWLRDLTPLPDDVQDELYARADYLTYAVVVVNVAIAFIQGILIGIALWALGFSNIFLWASITVVLSLLPVVGAPVVWIPASFYLALSGRLLAGIALFVYGTLVVGLIDEALRPILGGRKAELNPGLFIVGVFGGVSLLGFVGLFYGPLVLGMAKVVIEVVGREYWSA